MYEDIVIRSVGRPKRSVNRPSRLKLRFILGAVVKFRFYPSWWIRTTAPLYWINLSAGTVDMPHNDRRSRFSGGRSSGLELSATASPGCFVDCLIPAGTENLPVLTQSFSVM